MFVTNVVSQKNCVTKYFYKLFRVTTFTACTVTIAGEITSGLVRGTSSLQAEMITQLVLTHIKTRLDEAQSGCFK